MVQNTSSRAPKAEVKYNIKMADPADSRLIRKTIGAFFLGGKDGRPDTLKYVSIKNCVTPETKTCIKVLKLIASRYRALNPDRRAQVVSYEARHLI